MIVRIILKEHSMTTNPSLRSKEAFVKAAHDTYDILHTQQDLSPKNPAVNSCLSSFMKVVLSYSGHSEAEEIIRDPRIKALRSALLPLLSKAGYEEEKDFAELLTGYPSLCDQDLENFGSRNCYRELVAKELKVLEQIEPNPNKSFAFVGSGPLPLTAIDFHQLSGRNITCFDVNIEAVQLSRLIISNMGLDKKIAIVHADGARADFKEFGMVMIASLVPCKENVLARIRETAPEALVAVRSGDGAKAILYEEVNQADFERAGLHLASSARDMHSTTLANATLYFKPASPGPHAK
jgi:hypothetical protein